MFHFKKILKLVDDSVFFNFGKMRVLFVVKNSYGWACQEPIYKALKRGFEKNNITIAVCSVGDSFPIEGLGSIEGLAGNILERKVAVWRKWHYIIHTDVGSPYFHRNTVNIMIPHGVGFGNVEQNYNKFQYVSGQCDIYFGLSSHEWTYIESSLFKNAQIKKKIFIPVGSPKTDKLFKPKKYLISSAIDKEKIDKEKKTILIWSHWTETSLFEATKKDFVEEIVKKYHEKYNFIISGHGALWREDNGKIKNEKLWEDLKKIEIKYCNVTVTRFVDDLNPLIEIADIFISDHSSFTIECSVKDKPIFFYDHVDRVFNSKDVLYMFRNACYVFFSVDEALQQLEDVTNGHDTKRTQRQAFKEYFYSNPGQAADDVASVIKMMGKLKPTKPEKWKQKAKEMNIPFFS
jgi:CDP-glycerol glycerophosphotransferase (TagB/SpsB family)